MQFDYFEKVTSRVFQQICCNFYHFKYTRGQRDQRPKLCIFISSLIKIATVSPSDIVVEKGEQIPTLV